MFERCGFCIIISAVLTLSLPEHVVAVEIGHFKSAIWQSLRGGHGHQDGRLGGDPERMWPSVGPWKCNGRADVCNLLFDEVTLLGSHNAPAHDFRMIGVASRALNCAYADHNVEVVRQLKRGVRFLDFDTCLRRGVVYSCHGRGSLRLIKTPLLDELQAIKAWLDENPREVLMISFGDHDPSPSKSSEVAAGIAELVQKVLVTSKMVVEKSDVRKAPLTRTRWPSLGSMIQSGRRVVVAFEGDPYKPDNNLYDALPMGTMDHDFIFNLNDDFEYSWGKANKADYESLLRKLKFYCEDNEEYLSYYKRAVHLDAFMTIRVGIRGHAKEGTDRIERDPAVNKFYALNSTRAVQEEEPLPEDFLTKLQVLNATANASGGECVCTDCLAEKFNEAATRKRGRRQTSTLEESQRICSAMGFRVHVVKIDYEEHGRMFETVDRMNDENVKRFCPDCGLDLNKMMPELPDVFQSNSFPVASGRSVSIVLLSLLSALYRHR